MANFWQPKIDNWLTENINVNNTTSFPISYQYAPNEGEEDKHKVHVAGFGPLSLKEMRNKISEMLEELVGASKIEDHRSMEKVHHILYKTPELNNLIAKYIDVVKNLGAHNDG